MPAIPNHSINYFAPLAPAAPCSVGQVMIPESVAGAYYVVATTANRGTRGSEGVAVSAWGGVSGSVGQVKLVQNGILPAEQSGLAVVADRKLVRCSTTGSIERVDAYTDGDDIIGYAEANGRVHLHFGLPWQLIAAAAGVLPPSPNQAVTYTLSPSAFGAADDVAISSDATQALCTGVTVGTMAAVGNHRMSAGAIDHALGYVSTIHHRDAGSGNRDVYWFSAYTEDFGGSIGVRDVFTIGGYGLEANAPDHLNVFVNRDFNLCFAPNDSGGSDSGVGLHYISAGSRYWSFDQYTSIMQTGASTSLVLTPSGGLGGGVGVFVRGVSVTRPTTTTVGLCEYVDSSARLNYQRANGEYVCEWDGPEKTLSTTGTLTDVDSLDSNSLPIRTLYLNGAGDQNLSSLTAGREGRSIFIVSATSGGDGNTSTIVHNSGGTAANRIMCPGNVDFDIGTVGRVEVVYSTTASRWMVVFPKAIPVALGDLVGTSATQTLTNKTISNPKVSDLYASGQVAGDPNTPSAFRFLRVGIVKSSTADLTLSNLEYTAPILHITGTPGGNFNIIAPNSDGAFFIVLNTTINDCTFKKSGGTGVVIPGDTYSIVVHNGTDYVAVAA